MLTVKYRYRVATQQAKKVACKVCEHSPWLHLALCAVLDKKVYTFLT